MARDTTDSGRSNRSTSSPLSRRGQQAREKWRIGTEHEKFPFYVDGHAPVPYGGERGIRALLEGMQRTLAGIRSSTRVTSSAWSSRPARGRSRSSRAGSSSCPGTGRKHPPDLPRRQRASGAAREIAEPLGIRFLGLGGSPKWTLAETPKMPKSRYEIMTRYMPKVGTKGLDMMYRTCTIQVNLDFSSEPTCAARCRCRSSCSRCRRRCCQFAIHRGSAERPAILARRNLARHRQPAFRPAAVLLLARVRLCRLCRMGARRPDVFRHPQRPLPRHDHLTFRQFMEGAAHNSIPDGVPTIGDWANHLSTLFPDVRLKRFLEMRGADGGPWRRICALPAFWVGLLYDDEALDAAEALTRDWTFEEVLAMRDTVPAGGIATEFRNTNLREIAREALTISRTGLKNRSRKNRDGYDETHFLSTLDEVVARAPPAPRKCSAPTTHAGAARSSRPSWNMRTEP